MVVVWWWGGWGGGALTSANQPLAKPLLLLLLLKRLPLTGSDRCAVPERPKLLPSVCLSLRPIAEDCLEVAREYPILAPRVFFCVPPPVSATATGWVSHLHKEATKENKWPRQALHCLLEQRRRWRWQITCLLHVPHRLPRPASKTLIKCEGSSGGPKLRWDLKTSTAGGERHCSSGRRGWRQ